MPGETGTTQPKPHKGPLLDSVILIVALKRGKSVPETDPFRPREVEFCFLFNSPSLAKGQQTDLGFAKPAESYFNLPTAWCPIAPQISRRWWYFGTAGSGWALGAWPHQQFPSVIWIRPLCVSVSVSVSLLVLCACVFAFPLVLTSD